MDTNNDLGAILPREEREFLHAALKQGYFETPRRVTIVDLADEFDISDREAKRRLVSGMATVLQESDLLLHDLGGTSLDEGAWAP